MLRRLLIAVTVLISLVTPTLSADKAQYKTKNVIIAVMDGVRYQETFGDPKRALIPHLAALEKDGALFTNYRIADEGISVTRQGHSTISSGTWQTVALGGARMTMPSFFEYARNELGWKQTDCYAIFGKGKYAYADYSSFPGYGANYRPTFICGIGEGQMGNDDAVLQNVCDAIDKDKPKLILINFGYTDHIAHVGTYDQHKAAIVHCDEVLGKLWQKVQSTPGYKDETTVFFTNDHGRHNNKRDQPADGVQNHGDKCEGCRHIMLLAVGPDTKRGAKIDREVKEIDLCPTVGELLGFQTPFAQGNVVGDCLSSPLGLNKKTATTTQAKAGMKLIELGKRDLVTAIADANLARNLDSLRPSQDTELLMRGMLKASVASKNDAYRKFVESWVTKNASSASTDMHVSRVMLELSQIKGATAVDLAKVRECAAKVSSESPQSDAQTTYTSAAFLARAGQVLSDDELKAAAKAKLGLIGATQESQVAAFRQRKIALTPMACDVPGAPATSSEWADAVGLAALVDAAQAMPEDKMVRLACNIQECICSAGRPEYGANWASPAQSALTLALLLNANQIAPRIQWTDIKPPQGMKKFAGPRWAYPMQVFFYDSLPWQMQALRYQVDEKGHFGAGDPLCDGAMLMMLCDARDKQMGGGKLRTMMN